MSPLSSDEMSSSAEYGPALPVCGLSGLLALDPVESRGPQSVDFSSDESVVEVARSIVAQQSNYSTVKNAVLRMPPALAPEILRHPQKPESRRQARPWTCRV